MSGPLMFAFQNGVMVPLNQYSAARQYEEGGKYYLAPFVGRSDKSHDHFFACVQAAFENLPEKYAEQIPTAEHLRKWALIKSGFCNKKVVQYQNDEDAKRSAVLVRELDEYAIAIPDGCTVTVYTAETQKKHAMGHERFQKSKDAVMRILSELIGTSVEELQTESRLRTQRRKAA